VPFQSVLDGSEDFAVNISGLTELTEKEAAEFLASNVLTSGMEEFIMQSPESECRMMNAECRTEALPAICSGGQTAVHAKTRLNRAAAGRRDDSQARRLRHVRP
jgi:hypothetical protein